MGSVLGLLGDVFDSGLKALEISPEPTWNSYAIGLYVEFNDGVTQNVEPGARTVEEIQDLCEAATARLEDNAQTVEQMV